jgi:hypothetical protein
VVGNINEPIAKCKFACEIYDPCSGSPLSGNFILKIKIKMLGSRVYSLLDNTKSNKILPDTNKTVLQNALSLPSWPLIGVFREGRYLSLTPAHECLDLDPEKLKILTIVPFVFPKVSG